MKILIVDDSRTARLMIIQCLMNRSREEAIFFEAENGLIASDLVHKEKFDLIVTDILMPKMDGNTFIKKVRLYEPNRNTPIIILSSLSKEGMDVDILKGENTYLIQKPITKENLERALGEIDV